MPGPRRPGCSSCSTTSVALTVTGLTLGAVYALVALGYTLVYGVLRLINFAHSEVFMYGTFAALWVAHGCSAAGRAPPRAGDRRSCWSLAARVRHGDVSAIVALLLERFAYRPLRKRNAPPLIAADLGHRRLVRARRAHGPARPASPAWFGLDDNLTRYVRHARDNTALPEPHHSRGLFTIGRLHGHQRRHLRPRLAPSS